MFEVFRYLRPGGGNHKGTSPCKVQGCAKSTREAKPYCSEHIEFAPYVQRLLQILAGRDEEVRILELKRGNIPSDGYFYRETLLLLRSKDYTSKGLSRSLDISHHAAERLIAMMDRDGLARRGTTSRGDVTISGLGPRDLANEPEK